MTHNLNLPTIHVVCYGVNLPEDIKAEIAKAHAELKTHITPSSTPQLDSYEAYTGTKVETEDDLTQEAARNPKGMINFLELAFFESNNFRTECDRIESRITRHLEKLIQTPERIIPLSGAVVLPSQYSQLDTFQSDLNWHDNESKEAQHYHFALHANDALKAGTLQPYRSFDNNQSSKQYDIQIDRLSAFFNGNAQKLGYLMQGNKRDFVNMSNLDIEESPVFDIAQIVDDNEVNPSKIYAGQPILEMGC